MSGKLRIKNGVLQGSTIGPLRFNVYTNDINNLALSSRLYQYADDTALVFAHSLYEHAVEVIQKDISKLLHWMLENYIHVNQNKTKLLCIRSHHKQIQLNRKIFLHLGSFNNCSCSPLIYSPSVKYLGLYINKLFQWDEHINQTCKKLRTISAYINKLRDGANIQTPYQVYEPRAESILRYGITIYGSCPITKQEKINILLRRIARNIAYATHLHERKAADIMYEMHILNFGQLYRYVVLSMRYYLMEYKIPVNKGRTLRQTERFYIPRIFTNHGKRNRQYYVPFIFNSVSSELLNISSLKRVKKFLKIWCLDS